MKPVLSRAQMRAFDANAIAACGVPGVVLMENAGRGATDVIEREMLRGDARGARIVVVAGTGNNGGDGFVVGRHAVLRGALVEVFVIGASARIAGDAKTNRDAYVGVGGTLREITDAASMPSLEAALATADVVVDALFGTGLDRAIDGAYAAAVGAMNAARAPVVALDVPSGLDADTGTTLGVVVAAMCTVTFAHYKLGLLTPGGARSCGVVHVADIGVPAARALSVGHAAELIEGADVASWLTPRAVDVHKNGAGHVAVVAGSPGKTGAARMVAHAAMRAGAGLVTIATWAESATAIEAGVVEAMTSRIDRASVASSIDAVLAGKRIVVVGPGLGLDAAARTAIERVVAFDGPIVVDADALTLFAGSPESFASARAAILTPHPGECARLLGITPAKVEADRFAAVRTLAARARSIVLLKGAHTLVASPDGRVVVNATGSSALATAGSGDVLAGILGALACTLSPFDAACAAAFIHGLAGDAWSATNGDRGLLASEIADLVPRTIKALAATHTPCSV